MRSSFVAALALGAFPIATGMAQAQTVPVQAVVMTGTRLDVSATGEVTRVPDLAIISAGVQTLQPTATAAIEENAARMERVRAALKRGSSAPLTVISCSRTTAEISTKSAVSRCPSVRKRPSNRFGSKPIAWTSMR